ncbi:FbpB family small basic protein [Robertmurraya sp. P23]
MKPGKLTLEELMKRNKEELLKDKLLVERIEKRVEEKIIKQ